MKRRALALMLLAASGVALTVTVPAAFRRSTRTDRFDTSAVARSDIARVTTVLGSVAPAGRAVVQAFVPGRVLAVHAAIGDRVSQGQVLATLDRTAVDAELARRELAAARADLAVSTFSGTDAERHVKTLEALEARAELRRVRGTRASYLLRAPKAGEVVAANARPGETLPPNTAAFVIADSLAAEIDVEVDEFEVGGISAGQPAVVLIDAWSRRPLSGRVLAAPVLRRARSAGAPAMYGFAVTIDHRPPEMRWGFTARAEIEVARAVQVLVVPVHAVVSVEDRDFVIAEDRWGRRRSVPVAAGLSDDHVVAIEGELTVDDRVLIGDALDLRELLRSIRRTGG